MAAEVQFQIVMQRQVADVLLESDPRGSGIGAASAGENASFPGFRRGALVGLQFATGGEEGLCHGGVHAVPAQTKSRLRKGVAQDGPAGFKP